LVASDGNVATALVSKPAFGRTSNGFLGDNDAGIPLFDPVSGGWNFYSQPFTDGLGDYPKFGIWTDGLYFTVTHLNNCHLSLSSAD